MTPRLLLLAAESEPPGERWLFDFGDPSLLGWACVAAYLAAAWACFHAWRKSQNEATAPARALWFGLGVGLVALGINKQLDLQLLLIDVGRRLAVAEGWYANRRIVLGVFLGLLGLVGLAAAVFTLRKFRPLGPARAALAGFSCLVLVLLLRAAPWQPIRALLGGQLFDEHAGLCEVHLSELIELALLTVIALAARRYCQTYHVEPQKPEKPPPQT
jgi:hypothetical protein